MTNKQLITCDIDGILTNYPKCWLDYINIKSGKQYNSVDEAKLGEKNYRNIKDSYRDSDYKANLRINSHNKYVINELSKTYDIIFTTSRPILDKKYPNLYNLTYNWLKNNGLVFKDLIYKDIDGNFLKGLNVAFHIDDEAKYCNVVANHFNTNNNKVNTQVYLLNDNILNGEFVDSKVIVINDLIELLNVPFFSVCIPATNRGSTIYRALESVSRQKYRNFEVVIVDCLSDDNTVSEIEHFFLSSQYKLNSFKYSFIKLDSKPKGTSDWNEPVKRAKGLFVAMLEGDDYWEQNHLLNAYTAIHKNNNIGVYGSSSNKGIRDFVGLLDSSKAKEYCYLLKGGVAPPSESIFIRTNSNGNQYLYKSDNYDYSPEIALYMDIVLDGYDLYYTKEEDVFREPSANVNNMKTWYYFSNRFIFIREYSSFFSSLIVLKSKIYNCFVTMNWAFRTKSIFRILSFIKQLLKEVGILVLILVLPFSLMYVMLASIHHRLLAHE